MYNKGSFRQFYRGDYSNALRPFSMLLRKRNSTFSPRLPNLSGNFPPLFKPIYPLCETARPEIKLGHKRDQHETFRN